MTDADNKTTKIAKGLLPGKEYFVKFKVKDGEEESEWSKLYSFTTITNNAQPAVPGNIDINFQGTSAVAYWDTVTLDVNGKKSNVERYELQFRKNASDANPKAVSVPQSSETRLQWEITLKQNLSWWTTSQTSIDFRVRAVNKSGIASNWSAWDTGTSAGPAAPTNFSATGDINAINLKWTRSTSVNVVKYNLHYALTSSFTPNTANLVWSGDADAYTFRTGTYQPHYFQLSAEDEFGRISTYVTANAEPESPFGADGVAPDLPTGLSVTAGGTAPNKVANVSWTFNATGATNEDIQSFAIRWRKVGDTNWGIEFADKAARTLAIPLPQPFANYEFQIASVDWVANYSAYSATVTLTQAIPGPPPQLAAPTATGSVDGLAIKWTTSTAADVVSGGYYEVNIATNTGFTTGLLTYNTGNTYIDVNGLSSNTTYYVRVRAVDVEGLQGTWSATLTTATTSFPVTPLSDGNIPASSPAATVTGGIGYLYVNWTATTNQDPVTYEVHISTTNNFTPSGITKVAETPATNIVLEKDAAGANLVYGTTYYVKLLSKDRDGAASAYGTQGSGTPVKGTIGDLTLSAGDVGAYTTAQTDSAILTSSNGKNKITYATAAPVNGTNTGILGDTWYVRQSVSPFQITAVYELTTAPSTWTQRKINGLTIDNLDAASVTTGFLNSARIETGSLLITQVANLQNSFDAAWQSRNSFFADWPTTYPTGVANWASTAAPTKETTITKSGGTAMRFTEATTNNRGVDIAGMLNGFLPYEEYVTIEADVYLVSGNFSGAGILLDWTGATTPNRINFNFHTIEPNPTVGRWYRFTQTFKRPTATGTWTQWNAWAMTNFAATLSPATAKDIIFDKIGFRAATMEEITAYNSPAYADSVAGTARTGAVNDLKTLWGHPSNTTLIDGGDIFTRSIRAQTLVLADPTNYISDPLFQDTSTGSWTFASGSSVVLPTGTTPGYLIMNAPTTGANHHSGDAAVWNTTAGEEFFVFMEVWGDAANTGTCSFSACMAVYNAGGTAISFPTPTNAPTVAPYGPAVTGYSNVPLSAWNKVAGTITMPADAYSFRFLPFVNSSVANNKVRVRNIKIVRRNGGELIIDGTIKANALTTGTLSSATITLGTGGIFQNSNGSVSITDQGITVTAAATGGISASKLTTGTFGVGEALTVNGNMTIQGNTNIAASGYIQSNNYVANTTGFRLSAAGLDIRSGTIAVGTLIGGTISSQDIRIGAGGILQVDATGIIRSNNYSPGVSGWQLSATAFNAPGLTVSASSVTAGTFTGGNFAVGSGGSITSSGFSLSSTGLSLTSGTINGAAVYTNQLRSNTQISDGVTNRYTFNINGSGYAEVTGLRVYGDTILGSNSGSFIQSSSVSGTNGWRIYGSGSAEFYNLTISGNSTFNGTITANTSSTFNGTITANAGGTFGGTIYANMIAGTADPDGDGDGTVLPFSTKGKMRQGLVVRNGLTVRSQTDMTGFGAINVAFITGPSNGPEIRGNGVRINSLGVGAGSNGAGTRYVQCSDTGVLTSSTNLPSARHLKFDIRDAVIDSDKIMSLKPKFYKFKGTPNEPRTGFIADEVHDAGLIEYVGYEDEQDPTKPTGLFYQDIGVAHFAVTQEHHEEIKSLRAEVEQLKALVQSLLDNQ